MSPEFARELLDDFYAECDEHLSNARNQLARLEHPSADRPVDAPALHSLYRSTHSLKGICAIVGLRAAESLAHAAEGVLRVASRREAALDLSTAELLGRSVHRLEQIVAAHRLNQALPDSADLVAALDRLQGPATPTPTPAATVSDGAPDESVPPDGEPESAAAAGTVWRATFAPSAELDHRGVNINTVRSRLADLGRILSAVPVIKPGGSMAFNFTVALRHPPPDLAGWQASGVVFAPADPAQIPEGAHLGDTPPDPGSSNLFIAPSHIVRVDLSRLDELMRIAGEMVINRSRLEERIAHVPVDRTALQEVNVTFGRSLRELRDAIARVRLVPVAEIFTRMPFVVRDLARDTGKKVQLVVEGQHTEIDKYLVERLKEPLLHLVRNAVSHGVETPAERAAAGKPEQATVRLQAAASGQSVVIQVRDDGRGIDAAKVAARARDLGIRLVDTPTEAELLDLLCLPGLSTRDEADRAAGRGVGMAVVHTTVRELGGSLAVATQPGEWTQFTLRLPLTLSIAETFLVTAGDQTCAVPTGFVAEVVLYAEDQVRRIRQAEVISYRDGLLPLVRLRRLFGLPPSAVAQHPLVVLSTDRGLCGLVVDRIVGQREVVVRSMQDPLIQVPGISGATELGNGRPVLILDPVALSAGAVRPRPASSRGLAADQLASVPARTVTAALSGLETIAP